MYKFSIVAFPIMVIFHIELITIYIFIAFFILAYNSVACVKTIPPT